MFKISDNKKKALLKGSALNLRFLTILTIVLILFNVLSTKVLPEDIFLVSAAEIDVNELISLTNRERVDRGLSQLSIDSRLIAAAEAKGRDMIEKDYWSHYGPSGETPWEFIINSGYEYLYAGENLAKDFSSSSPIHNAWMASPTHRNNLLNPNFIDIGIATVIGEFQGKETTIVVQMFGRAYSLSGDDTSTTPEILELNLPEEGTLEAPYIIQPQDGDILNDGAFSVRGSSTEGDLVDIYDKDEIIGTSSIDDINFSFENENKYQEGKHTFYAQSRLFDGDTSKISNIVNISIDTIDPFIDRESAKISYVTIGNNQKEYTFSIEVLDNPVTVTGFYKEGEISFLKIEETLWEGKISENENLLSEFTIFAIDTAGNSTQEKFSDIEMDNYASVVNLSAASSEINVHKWFVENIFTRIFTRSIRGQVNFFISIIMIFLVSIERILLAKTGLTKLTTNPLLHLPVFVVLIFVSLIGGGGEVL